MAVSSFLASFYFVCGVIIFFLAVTILRHSIRSIVNWSTALVLIFAGFGPILGALTVFLEQNLRRGTVLFESLVGSFNYTWEFFFPSLVLFALVHPRLHRIWKYVRRFIWLLYVPHLFHLVMVIFLIDRVNPTRIFNPLLDLSIASGPTGPLVGSIVTSLNVTMGLLFKAHQQLFFFVNTTYAAFSLALLGRSLKLDLSPRVHRQMRIVRAGLGLCIVTYLIARFIPQIRGTGAGGGGTLADVFINASLILGGGSIAYAIVRYQFLDIRLFARKGIFYGASVALFASVYLLVVKQITGFISQYSGVNIEILETGLIILFIILSQPVLNRLEEWVERILTRAEGRPRVRMRDLSGELLSMVEVEGMKQRVGEALKEVFATDEVELLLCEELGGREGSEEAKRMAEVLESIGEPIVRSDFLEAMGYLRGNGRPLLRRGRRPPEPPIDRLPVPVQRLVRYELMVPVMREEHCVAVLLLGPRRENRRYTAQEQALLSLLSSQVAASLSRIDLLEEVVEKKVIEEELNIARTIQLNLLPSEPPRLEGYEASALSISSKYVGGDYYDYITREDGLLAFTVADVSGKGVPASLLMASLQASFRSMMDRMNDPVAVVSRLNVVMHDITAPDKFATLFYGCLDTRRHELRYTNAGHFFPALVREGGKVEVLDYSGLILGVQPEFRYESRKLKMHPGDTLVVTTDGVTEAENGGGVLFGEERLYPLLTSLYGRGADEVKETIVERVNAFSQPRGASDDLTILVLRRKAG